MQESNIPRTFETSVSPLTSHWRDTRKTLFSAFSSKFPTLNFDKLR